MRWYKRTASLSKTAQHEDTLDGQFMKKEMSRLFAEVSELRSLAASGGLDDVMPRWKGQLREKMLLLPSLEVLPRMSMYELRKLSSSVFEIRDSLKKYSLSRLREVMGDADKSDNGK